MIWRKIKIFRQIVLYLDTIQITILTKELQIKSKFLDFRKMIYTIISIMDSIISSLNWIHLKENKEYFIGIQCLMIKMKLDRLIYIYIYNLFIYKLFEFIKITCAQFQN